MSVLRLKPDVSAWRALAALSAGYFCVLLDQGLMPVITPQLPFDVGDAVWLTSVYLLCTVVPMPIAGRLGDAYGQRRIFLTGLALYIAALALAAVSWSHAVLIAARAVQGIGSSLFLPQAFGVVNRVFAPETRGRAFAAWGVVGSIASLIGPVVGGLLVDGAGWRAAFGVQAAVALAAFALAAFWVPVLPTMEGSLDTASVMLTLIGLGSLIYGIQYGQWWAIAAGCIGIGLLIWRGTTGRDQGFLPLRLLSHGNFAVGIFGVTVMGFAAASMFIPMMYWLQTVAEVTSTRAGLLTAPMSVLALVLTPVAGVAADRLHPKLLCVGGFLAMTAALAIGYGVMVTGASPLWFAVVTGLLGAGSAFIWAPNAATTMRAVPDEHAGAASGMYNTVRQVGSVLGVALVGAALTRGDISDSAAAGLLVPLIAVALGAGCSLLLRRDLS